MGCSLSFAHFGATTCLGTFTLQPNPMHMYLKVRSSELSESFFLGKLVQACSLSFPRFFYKGMLGNRVEQRLLPKLP